MSVEKLGARWGALVTRLGELVTMRRRIEADIATIERELDALDLATKVITTPEAPPEDP